MAFSLAGRERGGRYFSVVVCLVPRSWVHLKRVIFRGSGFVTGVVFLLVAEGAWKVPIRGVLHFLYKPTGSGSSRTRGGIFFCCPNRAQRTLHHPADWGVFFQEFDSFSKGANFLVQGL